MNTCIFIITQYSAYCINLTVKQKILFKHSYMFLVTIEVEWPYF